ncbi:thiamine pyrophosphate-requiring protein [Piscinibacter koreensis]|uniref:Thiamine pyrophosphate-requiring protein n=1 Tax=Piscinibacter koreensis TaxID=2742824 RepID=A0A7Y6NRP2_9BURK|nr:thiamine pyrophosphate-requiring protein [Schlegelella koreensis]NUZ07942.1 thiamine pyrophosphate-requiring protein [Schlegelella koreensis]
MNPQDPLPAPPTAARRLLEEAGRLGVATIFTNLGSDHPAFIEAFAAIEARGGTMPEIIVCPHEMTALSAAHGYAMATGRAQMVLVHVDVGTQNLGCSIHNAARGRVPAIVVAGLSPVSTSGERTGARTEFIHYTQDSTRQHEIGGQYMKWSYEVRAAEMIDQVLLRGLQIATSVPAGPVYLTGAREVWEEPAGAAPQAPEHWRPPGSTCLPDDAVRTLHAALWAAERPLLITSYLGRQPEAVDALAELAERIGIAVCEVNPQYVNCPGDHPHHVGYRRNSLVDEADLILMIDVDVPWIVARVQPRADARLFHIDCDVLKASMGFWHFPAEASWQADSLAALRQLLALPSPAEAGQARGARTAWIADARRRLVMPDMPTPANDAINIQQLSEAIAALLNERSIVVFEEPTATDRVLYTLRMRRPGSYFANGGSGLGWSINAAIGLKLACPDAEVITLVGDGSYVFGVPSSTYWVTETYRTPQLTIVFNNGGWNAPKASTLLVHPDGTAKRNDRYWITTSARARLADIAAAAGGAAAFRVERASELAATLAEALACVRAGRSAVVDVVTLPISAQVLGEAQSSARRVGHDPSPTHASRTPA